jgi:hypothetical protein
LFAGDASGRLPLVYVGSPLTGLSSDDRRLLDAWCKNVEDAVLNEQTGVAEWTLRTYCPLQQSPPWRKDDREPLDIYERNSRLLWGEVDALVLFDLHGGSLGVGTSLAWAGSMSMPVLVVVPTEEAVSRHIEGMSVECDLTVVAFADATVLQTRVRSWLNDRRSVIESADLRRTIHRQRAADLGEALRERWQAMSSGERRSALERIPMKGARLERLLTDASALIQASLHELMSLSAALSVDLGSGLSPSGRPLSTVQLRSLQQAAAECEWSSDIVVDLVVKAQGELASNAVRRLPLASIDDWVRLKETRRA